MSGEELTFRRVTSETVKAKASVEADEVAAPAYLTARDLRLEDGVELRQLQVSGRDQRTGYQRLDNEILAGLRLWRAAEAVGYPPEVSCLYGYEAASADPCVLLEPYRGQPLTAAGEHLLDNEQHQFQVSLLTGLCWLAAAGIAHRGIAPSTVRWDGQRAQITDFSLSTVFGTPREVVGSPPWAALEQRAGTAYGTVSARDDIWAAGRLIFYVHTREELTDRSQLEDRPALKGLLAGVFGPPEERPAARELLDRMNEPCPVPRALDGHSPLDAGRREFYAVRARKHPGVTQAAGAASPAAGARPEPPRQPDPVPPPPKGGRRRGWRSR